MLIKPTAQEAEQYIDFAYALALDPTRSGYPTYTDGIKTKEDFVCFLRKGSSDACRSNFLYVEDGEVKGYIQYTFLEEDAYLQTEVFNIAGSIRQALAEFVTYCEANFRGYTLYLGFPDANTEALSYLAENGWRCIERNYNDVLFFEQYHLQQEAGDIRRVTRENFADFRNIHAPIEGDMYWNSQRLYDDLDNWEIYLYYQNESPLGAIYYTDEEILAEIFGVDFLNDVFNETIIRSLLCKVLNTCKESGKRYMVFFNDESSHKTVLELGFICVGQYVLYVMQL